MYKKPIVVTDHSNVKPFRCEDCMQLIEGNNYYCHNRRCDHCYEQHITKRLMNDKRKDLDKITKDIDHMVSTQETNFEMEMKQK